MLTIHRARPLLGTFVEITVTDASNNNNEAVIDAAFAAVELVHRLMSFHDPSSDVSRINREAFIHPVAIHPWTYKVLTTACEISKKTDGLFDCTLARSLVDLDYLPVPEAPALDEVSGNYKHIQLLGPGKVSFLKPVWIDLGGIAKGFAVDMAVESLKYSGVQSGCVNAGGDLRVFGQKEETVYLRNPQNPAMLHKIENVKEAAVATSSIYFSRKKMSDCWVSPIIGPDKKPHLSLLSATVFASACMVADALTKPFLLGAGTALILKKFKARGLLLHSENFLKGTLQNAA